MSIELGRHADGPISPCISLDTNRKGPPIDYEHDMSVLSKGRNPSHLDFGANGGFGFPNDNFNLGGEYLGISFGDDPPPPELEGEKTPGQVQSRSCMCYFSLPKDIVDWIPIIASPLTTPPQTPQGWSWCLQWQGIGRFQRSQHQ